MCLHSAASSVLQEGMKMQRKGLWDNWAKHQKHALHSFSHLQYYIPKHHNQSSQEVTGVLSYVCSLLPVLHAYVYKQKGGNTLVLPPNHKIWVPYVINITLWKAYRNMNKELEPDCCPRRKLLIRPESSCGSMQEASFPESVRGRGTGTLPLKCCLYLYLI